ncbi:hypothetical protein Tco_1413965 [Tanacetum coccineum]
MPFGLASYLTADAVENGMRKPNAAPLRVCLAKRVGVGACVGAGAGAGVGIGACAVACAGAGTGARAFIISQN